MSSLPTGASLPFTFDEGITVRTLGEFVFIDELLIDLSDDLHHESVSLVPHTDTYLAKLYAQGVEDIKYELKLYRSENDEPDTYPFSNEEEYVNDYYAEDLALDAY